MDENTVQTTAEEAKTFTQDELNAIVSERIGRVKAKYEGFDELKAKAEKYDQLEEANKTELQKASEKVAKLEAEIESMRKTEEVRTIREKVASETGIPANLLTGDTEDDCKEQAEAIKSFAMPQSYPAIRDGGELQGTPKESTRNEFANWAAKNF